MSMRMTMAVIDRFWIWAALAGSLTTAIVWGPIPKDPPPPPRPWTPAYQVEIVSPLVALSYNQILQPREHDEPEVPWATETTEESHRTSDSIELGEPIIELHQCGSSFSLSPGGSGLSCENTILAIDRLFTTLGSDMVLDPRGGHYPLGALRNAGRTDVALFLEGSLSPTGFVADLERLSKKHGFRFVVHRSQRVPSFWAGTEDVASMAEQLWKKNYTARVHK